MWVRVFQLALPFDKMEILSPQRDVGAHFPMWVQVFPCGCEFFPCGCEFSNLHFPDKMKSCRHKKYRHLILSWFQAEMYPQILL